jgi:AcrR family transcriptional regulator
MTESMALPRSAASRGQFAKRQQILETASRVFCREGFAGASIDVIATEAGVSRQTIYNHVGDKEGLFAAVVEATTEKANADLFATLATFPDHPKDLEAELTAFARRLAGDCMCSRQTAELRKLVEVEGERYPKLFRTWYERGPGRIAAALSARLARLAHAGLLDLDDPDLAARQFMSLVMMDIKPIAHLGKMPTAAEVEAAAATGVRTFLRAYRTRPGK